MQRAPVEQSFAKPSAFAEPTEDKTARRRPARTSALPTGKVARVHPSRAAFAVLVFLLTLSRSFAAEAPFLRGEFLQPLEHLHNHGSCVVEAPNGDLLVCWFNGSGERQADDQVGQLLQVHAAQSSSSSRWWA